MKVVSVNKTITTMALLEKGVDFDDKDLLYTKPRTTARGLMKNEPILSPHKLVELSKKRDLGVIVYEGYLRDNGTVLIICEKHLSGDGK